MNKVPSSFVMFAFVGGTTPARVGVRGWLVRHRGYGKIMARVADLAWMLVCLLALLIAIGAVHGKPSVISVSLIVASLVGLVGIGVCVRAARAAGHSQGSDDVH